MYFLLDAFALAIIIFCVIRSAKKGFVYIAIEVVGFVAAIFLSVTVSAPLAEYTYKKAVEEPIVASVSDIDVEKAASPADAVWNAIPDFVKNSSISKDITKDSISKVISEKAEESLENAATSVSERLLKPITEKLLGMLYSTILFIILLIVVKLLAKVINKLFSFSVIGKANSFFGAIIGIPKGILIAAAFCFIVSMLITFNNGKFLIFTTESVEKSFVFGILNKISPYNR